METLSRTNDSHPHVRGRRVIAVVVSIILAGGGLVAAHADPPDGTYRAWIDDPLDGSLLLAGPVTVDVHGTDTVALELDDYGTEVSLDSQPVMDGRLSRGSFTWNATAGVHSLTVRSGSFVSVAHNVDVLAATTGPAPSPSLSPSLSPGSPSLPPASSSRSVRSSSSSSQSTPGRSTPARSTAAGPSAATSTPSPPTSGPSGPASSSSGGSSPDPSPSVTVAPPPPPRPTIGAVTVDNRDLRVYSNCADAATIRAVVSDNATAVTVTFSGAGTGAGAGDSPRAMTELADHSWAIKVFGGNLPKPVGQTFDVTVTATGPGGNTEASGGQVSTNDTNCDPIH